MNIPDITFKCDKPNCSFTTKNFKTILSHSKFCNQISTRELYKKLINETIKSKFFKSISKINNTNFKQQLIQYFKNRTNDYYNINYNSIIDKNKIIRHLIDKQLLTIDFQNIKSNIYELVDNIILKDNVDLINIQSQLNLIKQERNKYFLFYDINEFVNLVDYIYKKICVYAFNLNKHLNKSEKDNLINIISKSINGTEGRLLCNLDIKDQGVTFSIGEVNEPIKNLYFKELLCSNNEPFNITTFCNKFKNPLLSIIPFEKFMECILLPSNNIIYYELNNAEDDPFSIYTLKNITNNNRHWQMDTRAENLALELSDNIKNYCLEIFSNLWNFNKNKLNSSNIPIYKEIAKTIMLLSNPIKLSNKIRFLLKNKKKYISDNNDTFNIKYDDLFQKNKYNEIIDQTEIDKNAIIEMFHFANIENFEIDVFIYNIS